MKIKISPTYSEPNYISVEFDTLTNDDTTTEVVKIALDAIVAVGHDPINVADACEQWAAEKKAIIKNEDKHI